MVACIKRWSYLIARRERLRGIEYDGQDRSIDVRVFVQKLAMILKIQNVLKQ